MNKTFIQGPEVEQRWEELLTKYKSEHKKKVIKPQSGSGANSCTQTWVYYDCFYFMDNVVDHRECKSSFSIEEETTYNSGSSNQTQPSANAKNSQKPLKKKR